MEPILTPPPLRPFFFKNFELAPLTVHIKVPPAKVTGTFWARADDAAPLRALDTNGFEQLFAAAATAASPATPAAGGM